ncbi:MAG: efflux RND transporter periplasmic adaptor subunit [Proteobacteria bacterium]|jgi:HlyD family secretion protein|nr:efflux RND transporter periplasmic adaptor subunit [Pseudomonadota bacterium]
MSKGGKIIIVAAIVLALAGAVALKKMRGGDEKEVEIQTVATHVITPTILASGSLTYQTEIRMVSEVMGRVKSLYVKEGDLVKQGDVLLRLDPATTQAQVDALEAGLRQSKLAIDRQRVASDTLETKWKRYQQLRQSGVVDANTYDDIRSQNEQSKVELNSSMQMALQTEAQLKQAREQLAKTVLQAPISGRVTQLTIKVGETAVPSVTSIAGSDLLTIADTSNLYAEVNVNETDVARVVPGQTAKIVPAAFSEQSWEGTVETVAVSPRQIAGQGKSYPVKIRLKPSATLQFHTGMSCRAEIATRGTSADAVVAVPVQAVKYEESTDRDAPAKSSLFVVKDGRVKQRTVETDIADDMYISVQKGLAAGEQIVVGPARVLRFMRDGERVKPAPVVEEAPVTVKSP